MKNKKKIKLRRAFFFDRDGVINVDHGYVFRKEDFQFMPDIFSVFKVLSAKGYLLVGVTNQSGIGRGYYTELNFKNLTGWMLQQFLANGVEIAAVYNCPHTPDEGCACRKPEPGMFLQAAKDLNIDLDSSWMIGDKASDMLAAKAAGVPNRVLLGTCTSSASTYSVVSLGELLELPV